jgi:putative flippase GtrA
MLVSWAKILDPVPASVVAFACGALVGFICNRVFVFKRSNAGIRALGKYLALTGFSGMNNTILMYILINFLNWNYMLAQIFATACIFVFNYFCCKFWIFKEPVYVQ